MEGMETDLRLMKPGRDARLRLQVIRLEDHQKGSLGVLLFDRRMFCFTLEPDSQDPEKPRIPAGTYSLYHFNGYKYKNTLEIIVPDHDHVIVHSGNIEADTDMCVLIARDPGYLLSHGKKVRAILDSRTIYKRFQREIVSQVMDGHKIQFINYYP